MRRREVRYGASECPRLWAWAARRDERVVERSAFSAMHQTDEISTPDRHRRRGGSPGGRGGLVLHLLRARPAWRHRRPADAVDPQCRREPHSHFRGHTTEGHYSPPGPQRHAAAELAASPRSRPHSGLPRARHAAAQRTLSWALCLASGVRGADALACSQRVPGRHAR